MKRGEPPNRNGQLKRGKPIVFDPAKAAQRRVRREERRGAEPTSPPAAARQARRAGRQRARSPEEQRASLYWVRVVTAGGCVMCARFPPDAQTYRDRHVDIDWIQGHHLIAQQWLERRGFELYLWDLRLGLGVCRWHHDRHEHAVQRIPRLLVPAAAFVCADELDEGTGTSAARRLLEDPDVYPLAA